MARHHYLRELPKIGETVWYVATWREQTLDAHMGKAPAKYSLEMNSG